MASYNTPIITTQGQSLLKATIANNDTMTFTKIVFSSDDYSQTADSAVQALTGLSNLDLTAPAKSFTDVNGNLKIRAVGNNENTSSAFYIKTYGLYGTNKAGNELLIAVATTQNANFVPAYNGKQTNQIAYTFNIAISSTNNITLSSSTDVGVTQADLAGINNYVNSNASSASLAIASNASSINSVQSSVTANSSAIASNASNISSLQSNVASNTSSIGNLQSSVSNNASAIGSINNQIGALNNNTIANISTIINVNDMNALVEPGIYNFGGNHGSIANLPNGYDPNYDNVFVVRSSDTVNQLILGTHQMYFRSIGVKNPWRNDWDRLALTSDVNQINANMQYLSNRTGAIEQYYFHNQRQLSNTDDLNNVRATGTYTINNIFPQNMPTAEVTGSNGSQSYLYNDYLVVVFSDGSNVQQELINSSLGTHYQRSLYSTGSSNWQKLVSEDELQSNSNSSMIMHGVINQNGDVDLYNITTPGAYIIDGDTNHRKPNHWPFEPSWGQWGLLTVYEIAGILFQEIKTGDGYYAYRWQGWGWHTMSIPASSNPNGYTWS